MIGKQNNTLVKQQVKESKLITTGVKSIKFWHEATAGQTAIPFDSLNMPADVAINGFSNPTSTEILAANLALFHTNVEVFSSINQKLMEGLSYVVKNNQITFLNGYEAIEGEIFAVNYKNDIITGTNVVDARPLTATGVLAIGDVDFNVGEAFQTNKYPNDQLGDVLVFIDGICQFRNVANATAAPAADGNYQEVHAVNGFGTIIRFNDSFAAEKNVQVISRNLIAERPEISMLQLIENLGGQLDAVLETVADLAGVSVDDFRLSPNQVDLKAFGAEVTANKAAIAANTALFDTKQDNLQIAYIKDVKPSGTNGGAFNAGVWQTRVLNTLTGDTSFISLNANQITLQPGKYVIEASALAYRVNSHILKLRNITNSADYIVGSSAYANSVADVSNESKFIDTVEISNTKTFEIQHRCSMTSGGNGLGVSSSFGVSEVYTQVKITKIG